MKTESLTLPHPLEGAKMQMPPPPTPQQVEDALRFGFVLNADWSRTPTR